MEKKIATVFVVEDDPLISKMITIQLELFQFHVFNFASIAETLESIKLNEADVFIVDWMLPDGEGIDLVKELKKVSTMPTLMLTAKAQMIDKLVAFDAGFDDYLCKPFEMMELIARVKALLRRKDMSNAESDILRYRELSLDPVKHEVKFNDIPLILSPTEFKLMELFLSKTNTVFERDTLIELVLGYEYEGYGRTLDSHIARLRAKLDKVVDAKKLIHTVHRIGYKFGYELESE
jgi:two-component system OmpR family response regulator